MTYDERLTYSFFTESAYRPADDYHCGIVFKTAGDAPQAFIAFMAPLGQTH